MSEIFFLREIFSVSCIIKNNPTNNVMESYLFDTCLTDITPFPQNKRATNLSVDSSFKT